MAAKKKPLMNAVMAEAKRQKDLTALKAGGGMPYLKQSTKTGNLIENPYNPAVDPKYKVSVPKVSPLKKKRKP